MLLRCAHTHEKQFISNGRNKDQSVGNKGIESQGLFTAWERGLYKATDCLLLNVLDNVYAFHRQILKLTRPT